ncbi:MAG: hypothetical protein ACRBN8_10760 [Nannocystales bacterium]
MFIAWLPLALMAASAPAHESAVQRHHRKGVHCMDVIERSKCAIEQFEAVLDEDTRERELVTDAMVRLLRLYRKAGDSEGLSNVLRRYWDVGTARQSRGHLPYGMRFFSPELDVMFVADISKIRDARLLREAGAQTAEFIFTCDDQTRTDIGMTERWRRAERIALARGVETYEVYYEAMDARRARREKAKARQKEWDESKRGKAEAAKQPDKDEEEESKAPIFSEMQCELAKRLGQDTLLGWNRISGAASHQNYRRSMMLVEIPGSAPLLNKAVARGDLLAVDERHWTLPDSEFAGQSVHVVRVDRDQLLIAREDMLAPVLEAASKRKRRMNKELERLAQQVPRDSAMVFAMTQAAIVGTGFGGMKQGASTMLQALLPKPKGLQVSVSTADVAGVFTRVPTKNPLKGRMLVNLVQTVLEGQAQEDPEAAQWVENLDIAEAGDRRALLAAYLIDSEQMAKMLWDG